MPIFRRFGRPGLLGAITATAVVAGTATMTARAVNNGLTRRAFTQREAAVAEQLQTLGRLHSSGQLDDGEFAAAKSRLLTH